MTDLCHSSDDGLNLQLVDRLRSPAAYPGSTSKVEFIETHISRVFLVADRVYKLKKPVRFDFLDFTTIEKRKAACKEEVRLNRRLAPDVYLDVVPVVTTDEGSIHVAGQGTVVDWAVVMRRLPAEENLERQIADGRVPATAAARIADMLVGFYQQTPKISLSGAEYRRRIEAHVHDNLAALESSQLPSETVRRVHEAQLRYLRFHADVFDGRVASGLIVDGHGDLRPQHIYFDPEPIAIDCIEFNAEFRQLDIADELCFLEAECDILQEDALGAAISDEYYRRHPDAEPESQLRAFYNSYRACVRGKVDALRASQISDPAEQQAAFGHALRYLQLADRYRVPLGSPWLIVVRGLMGSGKSTLAKAIADSIGARWLQTDAVRAQVLESPPDEQVESYGSGRYSPENRQRVYEEMFQRANKLLREQRSAVLDGTFLSAALRQRAVELASACGAHSLILRCDCPADLAKSRIEQRKTGNAERVLSEARADLYDIQAREEEPDAAGYYSVRIDSTIPPAAMFAEAWWYLRRVTR